ncbi:MAG: hypothetical protein HQL53_12955 [Magnetococcales bacterium]|nr:hypothetical protein [Magnetococcales bacterium]
MIHNPELKRYLWQEMTPQRVMGVPVVLGLILLIIFQSHELEEYRAAWIVTFWCAFWGFALITGVMGARMAGTAVLNDIRDGTWDWRRTSSISPWSLAWGKLIGAPIFTWYVGVLLLMVMVTAHTRLEDSGGLGQGLFVGAWLLLVALLTHGGVLLVQIISTSESDASTTKGQSKSLFLLSLISVPLYFASFPLEKVKTNLLDVVWYGMVVDHATFLIGSALVMLGWMLLGLKRVFQSELQVRVTPWAWVGFLIYLYLYMAGFVPVEADADRLHHLLLILILSYVATMCMTLLLLLSENLNLITYRRLIGHYRNRRWRRLTALLPTWGVTLLMVTVLLGLILLLHPWVSGSMMELFGQALNLKAGKIMHPGVQWLLTAAFMFLLRDVAMVLFFHFGANPTRAGARAIIYMMMVYGLLPALFGAAQIGEGALLLFYPVADSSSSAPIALLLALCQALIAWKVLTGRVRRRLAV